jgi:glyceraldehyde 3-phosphate dehydrogenase
MPVKIAISGFGRIGRNVLRAIAEAKRKDIRVVAINDSVSAKDNAHLLKYDSVHGRFPATVKVDGDMLDVGMGPIKVLAERDPKKLPWKALGIDIVMECTGIFTDREKAAAHLEAGAKRVLVSAPSKGADLTVVYGVNHDKLTATTRWSPNASCTTIACARWPRSLNELGRHQVGLHDHYPCLYQRPERPRPGHKDPAPGPRRRAQHDPDLDGCRRRRGAVLPELKGKLDGTAIRVPTPNVSGGGPEADPLPRDHRGSRSTRRWRCRRQSS